MVMEAVPGVGRDTDLPRFCQAHLSSLTRSDQRRWGEVYVQGLVSVPGRKSIRRIADEIVGWRADQCLQQFVNQSTWKWEPVRRSLAQQLAGLIQPRAWVVLEAVFPKNGASSVGVAKQYAPSAGRVLNCQLGLAVLLVGDEASCPVNWRLLLPRCWDQDDPRRARTHLPDTQRHRPRWHHLIDAVDEMMLGWRIAPAPLLVDATGEPHIKAQLRCLDERGLPYVVQVSANTLVPAPAPDQVGRRQVPNIGELAALALRQGANSVVWQTCTDHRGTRVVAAPLPRSLGEPRAGLWRDKPGALQLIAEWPAGKTRPSAVWLTNLSRTRLPDLVDLLNLRRRAAEDLRRLEGDVGLCHFEGRSFQGWHHHVTLASLAHGYKLAREAETLWLGAESAHRPAGSPSRAS
jgi:SRSO17 transposase